MGKNLSMTVLLDFYGELLTEKQSTALMYYYDNDCSLSEIADDMGVSRQGARDFIKRGEAQLLEFEKKLGLADRFIKINNLTDEALTVAKEQAISPELINIIKNIKKYL